MYVVTNRQLKKDEGNLDIFSKEPNAKGPNELRLVKITKSGSEFKARLLDNKLSESEKKTLVARYKLDPDDPNTLYKSIDIASEFYSQAVKNKKHILVFVHGYNNDMSDIITTAEKMEKLYNVNVIPFSWPANGGGPVSGTSSYLSDKRDARVSTGAFDRFLEKLQTYHEMFTTVQRGKLWKIAKARHPDNHEEARSEYARLQSKQCKISINLLCHSMGNYLLKYATMPSGSLMRKLVFDNVCMVAADANNKGHKNWIEGIQSRTGIYVVINENDSALKWSRRKPGEEQLARLGHYLKGLNAVNTSYINVTEAAHVRDDHSYFKDRAVNKNKKLKQMFAALFEGRRPESELKYRPDINAYELR